MDINTEQQQKSSSRSYEVFFIILSFALWMFIFREYLLSKLALFDDAVSYFDHVKFYLDNIHRGVFPMWDPLWFTGSANSFFLQRMGCFNPFLHLTSVFHLFGIPYTISYLLYLTSYYFIGCLGFYVLAKKVLNHTLSALIIFVLLLFSSLGTRIFDSYMILMFTPIMWFFYFLVAFSCEPRRSTFIGLVLTLMVIFTTYIPFYFLLVFASFMVFYGIMYGPMLKPLLERYSRFVADNKWLVAACLLILLASLIPGYLFFKTSTGQGEFVMPARNADSSAGSALSVQRQDTSNSWSILEEIFFARYFYTDMEQIIFAILYIPLLAYIIFFLGFITKVKKELLFLFLWGGGLLLLCIPFASPVYAFFYKHIYFFKYFRNLHFLLWVTLLPMFCLFLGWQLKTLLSWQPSSHKQKKAALLYVTLIHGGFACYMHFFQVPIMTNYLALGLSYVFSCWWLLGTLRKHLTIAVFFLLLMISIEPFEVYAYLSQNSLPYNKDMYSYNFADLKFHYTRSDSDIDMALYIPPEEHPIVEKPGKRRVQPMRNIYYASKWYGYFAGHIDFDILRKYRKHRFILYDDVQRLDDTNIDFVAFETSLAENRNIAFVSTDDPDVLALKTQGRHSYYAQPLEEDVRDFKVDHYNANHIKIKTDFTDRKFLVYNDAYNSQWRVLINGHPAKLVRANIAFKGVWVPAGSQIVEFKFGSWHMGAIYLFLFAAINGMFIALVMLWRRENFPPMNEAR